MSKTFEDARKIYSECVQNENYQRGFNALDILILKGIDTCKALQLRSHLHYLSGNNILAENDLNEAIALDPDSGGLFYDRGVLHHHSKQYQLALRDFSDAANLAQASADDDLIDALEHHIIEILEKMRSA